MSAIHMSPLWGLKSMVNPCFYTHAGSLSSFLFGRLIPVGAKNLYPGVLLVERIIPTGIMVRYQVTLDIEEPYGSSIV